MMLKNTERIGIVEPAPWEWLSPTTSVRRKSTWTFW